jgi:hypothetical protein
VTQASTTVPGSLSKGEPGTVAALSVLLVLLVCACGPPRVRFAGSYPSPEAVTDTFLRDLEARDRPGLESLALSEAEYRLEFLPEMFIYGKHPTDFLWEQMDGRNQLGVGSVLGRLGGRSFELEKIVFEGGSTAFQTFVVHRRPTVYVRDRKTGEIEKLVLFGSVLEHEGGYKLVSLNIDR